MAEVAVEAEEEWARPAAQERAHFAAAHSEPSAAAAAVPSAAVDLKQVAEPCCSPAGCSVPKSYRWSSPQAAGFDFDPSYCRP